MYRCHKGTDTQKKLLENGHEITNYNYFQCEINIIIRPDATKV